jgi:predicted metalloprotease with PDZ domain
VLATGFSLLYTVFLPFRFQQRGPDYFRATLNNFLTAYFTNPLLQTSLRSASNATASSGWYFQAMQYTRGFLYALKMDTYSRWASRETKTGIARPIDNIIGDLSKRWRNGESASVDDFLSDLSKWLGEERTAQLFHDMLDGSVMNLADMQESFGDRHSPFPVEQEILEFGFDFPGDASTGVMEVPFKVTGVLPGSRAQQAGLTDGDTVVDCDGAAACLTDIQRQVRFVVERRRQLVEIEYWPRSYFKAVSWQVLERSSVT